MQKQKHKNVLWFQILDQYEKFTEYDKNRDGTLDIDEVRFDCPTAVWECVLYMCDQAWP